MHNHKINNDVIAFTVNYHLSMVGIDKHTECIPVHNITSVKYQLWSTKLHQLIPFTYTTYAILITSALI